MKTRLFYKDLSMGQDVQVYYGELTNCYYNGVITNMDGQNIVVKVADRDFSANTNNEIQHRNHESCNPEFAVVISV